MPRKWYVGVEGSARKVIKPFIGVNGKARRIKKAYVGVNGVARLYYKKIDVPTLKITYTGEWEDKLDVVMKGKTYRLLTLKTSGTLTIDETVACDLWMVGGGAGGYCSGPGGGGGYSLFEKDITVKENTGTEVVVGLGGAGGYYYDYKDEDGDWIRGMARPGPGGRSSFGGYITRERTVVDNTTWESNGGSGGGAYGSRSNVLGGTGDGLSKYPFEDDNYFEHPHGAGGGGGGYANWAGKIDYYACGGNGGSNGSNGAKTYTTYDDNSIGGTGGNYGGGNGGSSARKGSDATYYGGGGGGGGQTTGRITGPSPGGGGTVTSTYTNYYDGGNGFPGIVYLRIPYIQ